MKISINIKKILCPLLILCITSCIKYKQVDKELTELQQLQYDKITKLELIDYIDLDTVNSNLLKTSFKMKNVGTKQMNKIFIKGICDCTTISNYKKILLPKEGQTIELTIDLEGEQGNFLKEIFLYGTFYPYQRKIQVVGYKK